MKSILTQFDTAGSLGLPIIVSSILYIQSVYINEIPAKIGPSILFPFFQNTSTLSQLPTDLKMIKPLQLLHIWFEMAFPHSKSGYSMSYAQGTLIDF